MVALPLAGTTRVILARLASRTSRKRAKAAAQQRAELIGTQSEQHENPEQQAGEDAAQQPVGLGIDRLVRIGLLQVAGRLEADRVGNAPARFFLFQVEPIDDAVLGVGDRFLSCLAAS